MCGFTGLISSDDLWKSKGYIRNILLSMIKKIENRGPDEKSIYIDSSEKTAIAFQRLSILDLSKAGRQPMISENKEWVIVFNGEIYNYLNLKKQAKSWKKSNWSSSSDTEVILEYIAHFGFEKTIIMLNGMFSIVALNKSTKNLWMARDRFGEKPLYYSKTKDGSFIFSSEVKCFSKWPTYEGEINKDIVKEYLRYGYVPEPKCIYKYTKKLPPGCILKLDYKKEPKIKKYWNCEQKLYSKTKNIFKGTYEDAKEELLFRLNKSVSMRMNSDVPLGAFLSGGIDSTNIVLAMLSNNIVVNSFSLGFENANFDELPYANNIAKHLNTNHNAINMSEKDCLSIIDNIGGYYDEPFSDPSQIPTLLLCKYARKKVTVALSGDGGDELFGGYPRYKNIAGRWRKNEYIPYWVKLIAKELTSLFSGNNNSFIESFRKSMRKVSHRSFNELYLDEMSRWRPDEEIYYNKNISYELCDLGKSYTDLSIERLLMLKDISTYLPGNLLVKMDRASMAFGLEVRSPFLDHDLAEFCWTLPDEYTVNNEKKDLLRSILIKKIPKKFIDRPKKGFEPPLADWLNGPLSEWAGDILFSDNKNNFKLYDIKKVRSKFEKLLKGERKWTYKLWTVIMYEAWLNHNAL